MHPVLILANLRFPAPAITRIATTRPTRSWFVRLPQYAGPGRTVRHFGGRRPGFARRNRASREAVGAGYPSRRSRANDEFEVGQLPATSLVVLSSTAAS